MEVSEATMAEVLNTLETIACQYWACDGPTLEPVAMATCHRCSTLALVRVAMGQPVRLPDEEMDPMEARRDENAARWEANHSER